MSLLDLRSRSASLARWHGRAFGALLAAKALEGVVLGRARVFAGEGFAPNGLLHAPGLGVYLAVVVCQVGGALALWPRRGPPALLRGLVVLGAVATTVDTLVAAQNNRLLLTIMAWLVALGPRPSADRDTYWHLDAIRWQVAIVYATAGLQKLYPGYLAGDALSHLGQMPHAVLGLALPFGDGHLAAVAAWLVVATEILLPVALFAGGRGTRVGIGVAVAMHLAMTLALPDVWSFSATMLISLLAFVPESGSRASGPGPVAISAGR